jgi:hypothetical protein
MLEPRAAGPALFSIGWGKLGWPHEASLLEFERTVNEVVTAYPAAIICIYGLPHLTGASLIMGGSRRTQSRWEATTLGQIHTTNGSHSRLYPIGSDYEEFRD